MEGSVLLGVFCLLASAVVCCLKYVTKEKKILEDSGGCLLLPCALSPPL